MRRGLLGSEGFLRVVYEGESNNLRLIVMRETKQEWFLIIWFGTGDMSEEQA